MVIPVFEAPDEPGHFLYAFYISKYNKIPSQYNEPISSEKYIEENIDENLNKVFYMDDKYMFYKMLYLSPSGYSLHYIDQSHQPLLYYLISSQVIKPFSVDNIDAEINYGKYNNPNRFINNKILKNSTPTIFLVLILRLFQVIYGVFIIIFIYKIIKLLSNDKFGKKSIFLISSIAFLPQFIFLCSYINNDVLATLFGLISVYFIVLLFKRDKAYLSLLSILFAIIASFTKPTILVMLPVIIIALIIWSIIKKKKWAILGFLIVVFLIIAAFYYIMNFKETNYNQIKIEGWHDNYRYEDKESNDDMLILEKNYALSFDGIDDRVIITRCECLRPSDITIEFWVKSNEITTPSDWNGIIQGVDGNGYSSGWRILDVDNKIRLQVNFEDADPRYIIGDVLNSDTFYHIAFTYNHQYLKLYQNGNVIGNLSETRDINWSESMADLYIGFAQYYFNGIIDEVRIWNIARTQEQIRSNMYKELKGNEEGLVGYWNFNEGRGSTVYDSTANRNNGKIQITSKGDNSILNKISRVSDSLITNFKDTLFSADNINFKNTFFIDISSLTETFKSTVAVFGWMKIFTDKFIYNYFLVYIVSGILLFFINIKEYRNSKKSVIFIIVSIISIFIYFLLYAIYTNWAQQQGRIILLAVFLTYILAILGFKAIKTPFRNILYYGLFSSSLFISVFCLYNYIYLNYY